MRPGLWLVALATAAGCSDYGLGSDVDPHNRYGEGADVPIVDESTWDPDGRYDDAEPDDDTIPDTDVDTDIGVDTDTGEETADDVLGGHFDVDTSSFIASIGDGSTDAHFHEYDDAHAVKGVDYFGFLVDKLHEITEDVDPNQRFKLLVVNADLSIGGRLSVNKYYIENKPVTWEGVAAYDDTSIEDLRVYSLSGVDGSTRLTQLALNFDAYAIYDREVVPTQTGCVVKNVLGANNEWRNGALTLQAVAVDDNGNDAFTVDPGMSAGGHGVATSGLLWESTLFWHWDGPCYHEDGWASYDPGG